jgi:hypothetical protein
MEVKTNMTLFDHVWVFEYELPAEVCAPFKYVR